MSRKWKPFFLLSFPFLVLLLGTLLTSALLLHASRRTVFEHISAFCEFASQSVPEAEPQLLEALKDYRSPDVQDAEGNHYLEKYGYRPEDFDKGLPDGVFLFPLLLFPAVVLPFAAGILILRRQQRRRIAGLVEYLEQVNMGAPGTLIQKQEDGCSHLQDEIYKTVTKLCQAREDAVTAKKNFAENLANISHQLKTPITAASLSLQLMKNKIPADCAGEIERQLERLARLEESLLLLSRIDAGTLPLKREKVDLYTALNLAAENLSGLLQKNGISVEIPDRGCIEFCGDLDWTMEALMNLIKNCMEHSRPGGTVHCDYSVNPLYAAISIWDDGEGFDAGDLPHLFERFYRGRRAAGNGIGIGLALARSIFELQNGILTACNLPGKGACFEIRIYSH